jgi:hypothetical protein
VGPTLAAVSALTPARAAELELGVLVLCVVVAAATCGLVAVRRGDRSYGWIAELLRWW